MVQLSQFYMGTGKIIALTVWIFVSRVMFLLFCLGLSCSPAKKQTSSDFMAAVILEPKKRKSVTTSTFSPLICHAVMGPDAMILGFFLIFRLKLSLSFSSFTLIRKLFSSSSLSVIRVVSSHIWGSWCFSCLSWFQLATHPAWHFSWYAQHID